MGLFVDLAEFTCFYHFLHDVIIKLFSRSKQFYDHIMQELVQNREIQLNQQTMSSFGLIGEDMKLSHTNWSGCATYGANPL